MLKIDTDFLDLNPHHRSFSFASESDYVKNTSNCLPVARFNNDDLVTPQFICDLVHEKEEKINESRFEFNDSNINENVKVSKVRSKICLNTLKINTSVQLAQMKTDTNMTQDSLIYKENCRSMTACGCIII